MAPVISASSQLTAFETRDAFLQRSVLALGELLGATDAEARLAQVQLYVVDYGLPGAPARHGRYHTANCAALRDEDAILVNESFLFETEAALRSFEQAATVFDTPYLRSDEALSGLVARIRPDPRAWATRLRKLGQLHRGAAADDEAAVEQFAWMLLFLIGHELGHLLQGHDARAFGAFVEPDAPLEHRLGNAVLKLCRHAREFHRFGFGLPGFERALDEGDDVAAPARAFASALADMESNHAQWFADEASADRHAAALVQQALDTLAARDPARADRRLQQVVRALFAAGLYQWQRDLVLFAGQLGMGPLRNAHELALAMLRNREQYVRAASLFGEVHRFTLLRAVVATGQLLHARGWLDEPLDAPLPRRQARPLAAGADDDDVRADCLQRHVLLRIHLDTAVKIAHVGCATGWLEEQDLARGTPQLLMVSFETIEQSVDRLRQLMQRVST